MRKAYIKKLVHSCYIDGNLDPKHVENVTSLLTHAELKQFVKVLKTEETKKTVTVTSAQKLSIEEQKQLKDLYKGNSIHFQIDPELLTGMRVQNADMIYEQSLKNSLEEIEKEIITL